MKEIKDLCEEILKGIKIIEDTQRIVDEQIGLGVKIGASSQAISECTQNGRGIILDAVGCVKSNTNNLVKNVRDLVAVYNGTLNGKPQQYDTTSPQQEYEAQEMEVIRSTARFEVTAIVSPASNAA